ncbi:MAG TPA: DUF3365 domain-containing protein, partial [Pirellulales bacterium]|nr:DUF3365 domain-containing protein [Pirellulales bacterium]
MNRRSLAGFGCGALFLAGALSFALVNQAAEPATPPPAASSQASAKAPPNTSVESARREVRLVDDIYKSAIILITKNYVDSKSDLAAGKAFKLLFQSVKEKGWHEVRLLDGLGEPINEEDIPRDAFEKTAIQRIMSGKDYYEEIATKDGKQYLRAATAVPMAMEKCTLCHDNYRGKKVVGALSYTLPLELKP